MKNKYNIFDGDKKFHGDDHNVWSYCLYLGSYVSKNDEWGQASGKYDLGICGSLNTVKAGGRMSFAIVCGTEEHEYISGAIIYKSDDGTNVRMNEKQLRNAGTHDDFYEELPVLMETITRYRRYLSAIEQQHTAPSYDSRPSY